MEVERSSERESLSWLPALVTIGIVIMGLFWAAFGIFKYGIWVNNGHGSFHVTLYLIVDSASREEVLEAIDFYWCWRRGGAVFTVWPMAEGSLSSRHVP